MLGGQPVQTVDLVAAVLRYVSDELLRQFNGESPDELWLTHPARWEVGDPRVERLEAAALQAGFPVTTPLAEPCAAALALDAAGQLDTVGEREPGRGLRPRAAGPSTLPQAHPGPWMGVSRWLVSRAVILNLAANGWMTGFSSG